MLVELFRYRWAARLLILAIGFFAAVAGLLSPFFQKVFVDRLLDDAALVHRIEGAQWLESASPPLIMFMAFSCALLAQGFALLSNYIGVREGALLQRRLSERLYRKMLSLRTDMMGSTTVGEVVSLYATDVSGATVLVEQAIPMGAGIIFPVIFAPLAIQWLCGIPLAATLWVIGAIVTLNIVFATRQSRFFFRFKQLAAERTGIVNEWIQNIRLLRILGWTENFEAKIFRKRQEETRNRVAMVTNGQAMGAFGTSISFFINLTGVAALVFLRGGPVRPSELFALLWIFGVFLARPFRQIPWIFTFSFDSLTSIRRLQRFLERPSGTNDEARTEASVERVSGLPEQKAATPRSSAARTVEEEGLPLEVRGLNLSIRGQQLLRDVHFEVKAGELVAIVGEVGSGKSLLTLSLVAETGASFDSLRIGGIDASALDLDSRREYFAFVPQEGFVMSATLRDNVAFRYEVSAERDTSIFESLNLAQFRLESEHVRDGLDTEIGERGVNLSGGQRQRVSLARAHYLDRPIVLLDDCLSALDVDTENQLIRDLIDGAWSKRTRILVTHRLTVLEKVDRVLFMEDGCIVEAGTFEALMARSHRMRAFVASVRRTEDAGEGMDSSADAGKARQETQRGSDVEAEVVS